MKRNISIKLQDFILEQLSDNISDHLIDGKFLYHYTYTDHLESILDHGLIPRYEPNSDYTNGIDGVFLTVYSSLYKINLPSNLMDRMEEFDGDGDPPIVRLKIDITKLDYNKFTWDDDYALNAYGWNKAISVEDKIIESLSIWGSIVYTSIIIPDYIVSHDYNYSH